MAKTKHKARLIPAIGGGKEDPPELLWRVMLFNAVTKAEIENAFAYGKAHPDEEAAPTDDAEARVKQLSPAAFLAAGAWDEDLHPRGEHGKFGAKDDTARSRSVVGGSPTVNGFALHGSGEVGASVQTAATHWGYWETAVQGRWAADVILGEDHHGVDVATEYPGVSPEDLAAIDHEAAPLGADLTYEERSAQADAEIAFNDAYVLLNAVHSVDPVGYTLYRGMTIANDSPDLAAMRDLKVGDTFDISLASFSGDPDTAQTFAGMGISPSEPHASTMVTMQLDAGAKAVPVEGTETEVQTTLGTWSQVANDNIVSGRFEVTNVGASNAELLLGIKQVGVFDPNEAGTVAPARAAAAATVENYTRPEWAHIFDAPLQQQRVAAAWDEGLHPRDFHGRFGEGGDAGRSVLKTVREQGGMTVSPLDGSSPTTGYVVARPDIKGDIMKADDFFDPSKGPAAIVAFMDSHPDAFDEPGEFLGLWHDTAHGEVALDAVEVMENRDEAIAAGASRDEQAVWDVAGGVEIPTGGTGHRAAATTLGGSYAARYDPARRRTDPPRQAAEAVVDHVGRGEAGVGNNDPRGAGGRAGLSRSDTRLIGRLTALRQQLGTRLLAQAQQAYEAALRSAGVKVVNRARSRTSPTRMRQAIAAVDTRQALAPWLAAVGLTEEDMLAHAFDTFNEQTIAEIRRYRERQAALVARLGVDVPLPTDPVPELIADYMVAGLTAMVRSRLLLGDQAAVAAQQAAIVPLEFSKELAKTIANQTARDLARKKVIAPRRQEPDQFDLPLGLPDPDELAQAAAKLVRNALFGADGRVHPVLPSTPDRLPTVVTTDNNPMPPTIEERLALEFTVSPVYRWEHGFYGEPLRPFDEHEQLDGLETTDREADPVLINTGSWPPSDIFAPGDHDGCTCEWVVAVDGGE